MKHIKKITTALIVVSMSFNVTAKDQKTLIDKFNDVRSNPKVQVWIQNNKCILKRKIAHKLLAKSKLYKEMYINKKQAVIFTKVNDEVVTID